MSNDCRPQLQACAMRVARLEPNGVPDPGANNLYVTDAFTRFGFTANKKTGDEFEVPSACGAPCVSYKDCDRIKWYDCELEICTPDPELTEILAGGTRLVSGAAVGWAAPRLNLANCPNGVSLEFWAKRINDGGTQDVTFPWAWWVFPRVYLTLDEGAFENGPHLPKLSGHFTENENWWNGPLNDWPLPNDTDGPFFWIPTTSMPAAGCGYITLAAS